MAKAYASEMAKLADTVEWAEGMDIAALCKAVRIAGQSSLRAIGSGGSLTAAHALASLHQQFTGRIASVATPLEAVGEPLDVSVSTWLLSAGGGNVDVIAAAEHSIRREPYQLAVLCGREDSPLAALCKAHTFVDLFVYRPRAGKDGFLATNSLVGFTALLARAYAAEFGEPDYWKKALVKVRSILDEGSGAQAAWEAASAPLWSRPTTLVLHGPATRVGAIDLESKFTEAALGNLQVADYRNFAHGRHHWLAKRADISGVLAFISDDDRRLAKRTLALIPPDVPQAVLDFSGNTSATAIASLIAALRVTGWAGVARGIDPGRPGVPEFGRKLYNLRVPRTAATAAGTLSPRDEAAVMRKSGRTAARLAVTGELDEWRKSLDTFRDKLSEARFAAAVFDYDGTIVDTRHRTQPPKTDITAELVRFAESGAWVAIATGRGASVRGDLRNALPPSLWDRILVGYYNGAEVAWLAEDNAPDRCSPPCDELASLASALRVQPELVLSASQTDRRYQLTLEEKRVMPEGRLWDLAQQVILNLGVSGISVTRSSHSIDIVPVGISKLKVIDRVREWIGDAPILTIGDRGRWPGNDYQLLREPYSLGVDEISVDPMTCWNLAPPGQRGPAATLDYLNSFEADSETLRLLPGALK